MHSATMNIAAGVYYQECINEEFLVLQSKALDLLLWLLTHWDIEVSK